jgi:hypothetical protein
VVGDDPELEVAMAHRGGALAVAVGTGVGTSSAFARLPGDAGLISWCTASASSWNCAGNRPARGRIGVTRDGPREPPATTGGPICASLPAVSLEELKFFFQTGAEQVLGSDAHQRLRGSWRACFTR